MNEVSTRSTTKIRKRASTPRSKTGCVTCKIRRLKCGEERPSCHRCKKSGWICDGYDFVPSPHPQNLPDAPTYTRSPSFTPSPTPSLYVSFAILELNPQEQYYFQYFVENVSDKLPSQDAFFWKGLALQESVHTFSVRHAIVAAGALAESSLQTQSGGYIMGVGQGSPREFALQQYEKAIRGLRQSIKSPESEKCTRTTLITCIVLAFFDNFIGNGGFALQHIRYAREVMVSSRTMPLSAIGEETLESDQLATMFLRLDMQALCSMGIEQNRTFIMLEPHAPSFQLPNRLSSLDEAKNIRNQMVWEGYRFMYATAQYCHLPRDQVPSDAIRRRDFFIEKIHMFHALISRMLNDTESDFTCHPLSRPESLKLYSTVLLIRLVSSLGALETSCDGLFPHFQFLLNVSEETIEHENNDDILIRESDTFNFEVRTVAPLMLVATKCRNMKLRREAVDLLMASHRREWMYDSFLAGKVSEWMIGIEEEGMDETGYIPEEARVWGEHVKLDLQRRNAFVRCKQNYRNRMTGAIDWRWREQNVSW